MEKYKAIGLMSGSSLDGLDIAYCEFALEKGHWSFKIVHTDVVAYPDDWIQEFKRLPVATGKTLWETHAALGAYFGGLVNNFVKKYNLKGQVDFVASHGHTIFHFPDKHFTTQIGDGAAIAAVCGIPVICDFRSTDIADGGQGTPIVPIGDKLLFTHFKYCLNIGGIANISGKTGRSIVAFDICSANQILNMLANRLGHEYDAHGALAASGQLHQPLLEALNRLSYYQQPYPKSLDNSFSREVILPTLEEFQISIEDKLRTYTEHIAAQVTSHIGLMARQEQLEIGAGDKILATGGGAFNRFLMERIQQLSKITVEVPGDETVKFKEALVIAFMGVLRMRNEVNVLKSVTGAAHDSVAGAVYRR